MMSGGASIALARVVTSPASGRMSSPRSADPTSSGVAPQVLHQSRQNSG
jgi:hypothetical protein